MNHPARFSQQIPGPKEKNPVTSSCFFWIMVLIGVVFVIIVTWSAVFGDYPTKNDIELVERVERSNTLTDQGFRPIDLVDQEELVRLRRRALAATWLNYYRKDFLDLLERSDAVFRRETQGFSTLAEGDIKSFAREDLDILESFLERFRHVASSDPASAYIDPLRTLIESKGPEITMRRLVLESEELLDKDKYIFGTIDEEKEKLGALADKLQKQAEDGRFKREASEILAGIEKRLKGFDAMGPEPTNVKAAVRSFLRSRGYSSDLTTLSSPEPAIHKDRPVWRVNLRFRLVDNDWDFYVPYFGNQGGRTTNFYFIGGRVIGWDGV
jgi:hypothetical protein